MPNLASDDAIFSWLREQLRLPVLSTILSKLKERRADSLKAALALGDTNKEKTQIAELTFVIEFFEHFDEYADTETETATADTETETV